MIYKSSFLLLELVIPLIYWRCFYEFLEFQANSRKFILWNTKLNPKRQSLSSQNFQILPFVKIYSIKNFSNFITKIPFQTFQSEPPVMLKNHKLQTYKLQAYKKKKKRKKKERYRRIILVNYCKTKCSKNQNLDICKRLFRKTVRHFAH